jgi:hypothetical protein
MSGAALRTANGFCPASLRDEPNSFMAELTSFVCWAFRFAKNYGDAWGVSVFSMKIFALPVNRRWGDLSGPQFLLRKKLRLPLAANLVYQRAI